MKWKTAGGKLCGKHKNEQTMKTFRKIKEISEIKQNKRKKNTQTTNDKKQIRATSSTKIKKQFSNAKLNKNKTISHYDLVFFLQKCMFDGWGYRRDWKRNAFTFISTQPASFSASKTPKLWLFFNPPKKWISFKLPRNHNYIAGGGEDSERVSKLSFALEFSHKLKWIFINAHLSVPTLIYRCHNRHLTLPLLLPLLPLLRLLLCGIFYS